MKDQVLGATQKAGHLPECGDPAVDAGVGQLLFGFVVAYGVGEKQAPVGHGRVGKVGFAIMLKGRRGITLMGKGERRLLSERDAAAGALSTHDPANDDDNKLFDYNAKFSGPGVVAFEALGRLAAQVAKRRGAGDVVPPNSVGICFDFLYCLRLVGRESRHETSPPEHFVVHIRRCRLTMFLISEFQDVAIF